MSNVSSAAQCFSVFKENMLSQTLKQKKITSIFSFYVGWPKKMPDD